MPNIQPQAISSLVSYMQQGKCDIGTLASEFSSKDEIRNPNVVKVAVKDKLSENMFVNASDFFRVDKNSNDILYHHVGIYAFTNKALMRYVSLERSKLELDRKLEQMRALENSMSIHVGYIKSLPLSVDTEEDLIEIRKIMEK
jgi:3-deoxy-manno-octulosonate cytidylyltransferase (CMP-KDO synthetase)